MRQRVGGSRPLHGTLRQELTLVDSHFSAQLELFLPQK
jgi:hypothetical protein